jgi:hypothetical protein
MILSAKAVLSRCIDKMTFPMPIYAETGDQIVYQANSRLEVEEFANLDGIIGVGSWGRVKRLRLNPNASPDAKIKVREKFGRRLPVAEDNSTITTVSRTFTHHAARSAAYGRGLTLNGHCL